MEATILLGLVSILLFAAIARGRSIQATVRAKALLKAYESKSAYSALPISHWQIILASLIAN